MDTNPTFNKILLNLGAGTTPAPEGMVLPGWQEIRIDLVPPADFITDVRELPFLDDYVDCVFSSHLLEHLPEEDIVKTLTEWRRVLKPTGTLILAIPDIQAVAKEIIKGGVDTILYYTSIGTEIRAQDMLHGWQARINEGKEGMRHLCS